jgi:hypothetical protein
MMNNPTADSTILYVVLCPGSAYLSPVLNLPNPNNNIYYIIIYYYYYYYLTYIIILYYYNSIHFAHYYSHIFKSKQRKKFEFRLCRLRRRRRLTSVTT